MAKRLFQKWSVEDERSLVASGTIAANLLVTHDLTADADGNQCKQVAALTDLPIGMAMEDYTTGQTVRVIYRNGTMVPLICVDSSIAVGVKVYNDAGGKVSATQGTGATLVGITLSATAAANALVSVRLGSLGA